MLPELLSFSPLQKRLVQAQFSGGHITSDAGLLLVREIDLKAGISLDLARCVPDERQAGKIQHPMLDLVRQRLYSLACGYEDLNDHDSLREDHAFQTALNRMAPLASKATLGRMEQRVERAAVIEAHRALWERFVASCRKPPRRIILDFDASDIPVHGNQEGRFFHGYYDHYCFLPLYVFCGRHPLVSYLRPSNIDAAKHSWAITALLVKFLRRHWPRTQIIVRADSGFCRHRMLDWMDRHRVDYIIGVARNSRLLEAVSEGMDVVKRMHQITGDKQVHFIRVIYGAQKWKKARAILAKLEVTEKGPNPRFVVSSLWEDKRTLYRNLYCARGDMENRIKDTQLDLFGTRTSSPNWWTNQWRMLLSTYAYLLFEALRKCVSGTEWAKASINTLRLRLLKIGAVIIRNTRRIRFLLSDAYPHQELFAGIVQRLRAT